MEFELTVVERLGLLALLPREANLTTLRIIRELQTDLSFSEEEHKVLKFQEDGDQLTWDPKVECLKTVAFGAKAMQLVQEKLAKLSKDGKLRIQHLSLCDKFSVED